ncbi:MAG: PE family protein [Mycobacterium sp.]|nr:PE family protein [Mycobacterium sp.]
MVFGMELGVVGASAATESGLASELAGLAAGVAPALLSPVPMAADLDAPRFAAIAAAAGAQHVGVAEQHAAARGLYAGAQVLAVNTVVATELMRAAAASL